MYALILNESSNEELSRAYSLFNIGVVLLSIFGSDGYRIEEAKSRACAAICVMSRWSTYDSAVE